MDNFTRKVTVSLESWRVSDGRKPLIIRGARQVGKTTVVRTFARSYEHYVMLNLERSGDRSYFEKYEDIQLIVEDILLSHQIPSKDLGSTLLFIDEIQESPKAIQLLRYFYEDLPALHVIAAGSLLEFALAEVKHFPVGRVQYLYMYPLNFEEYLGAMESPLLLKALHQVPVKKTAHQALLEQFNRYAIIGGMPEVMARYKQQSKLSDLIGIYEGIWSTYKDDVENYGKNATQKKVIRHIMETGPSVLDKRVKFQNFGNSNYKSREVSEAMRDLDRAKVIRLIYPTTDMEIPIRPDFKKSPRLQFLDTGIVNHALQLQTELLGVEDLSSSYKGALIPHLVTQELLSLSTTTDRKPNFWVREKSQASSEVDLVYPYSTYVIPIEIKSGKAGKLRSLHQFMERADHPYAIRLYGGAFSVEETITPGGKSYLLMNMPYYLGAKIPEYIAYLVGNYELN